VSLQDSWPFVEVVLHKWLRESTGLPGASVGWPADGLPRKDPPCVELRLLGGRTYARPGAAEVRTAQPVEWLATLTAGPGTHALELLVAGEDEPFATATVTMPGGTSIGDARDALLAEAVSEFSDVDVSASGDSAITLAGTDALAVFHLSSSASVDLELVTGPQQVVRATPEDAVVSIEFRSSSVTGSNTARAYSRAAMHGMRDYDELLQRAGWKFGAIVGDRPGYQDDAAESRHVLDVQLLGHVVDIRPAKPWVRKTRTTLTSPGQLPAQNIDQG
jgi:hypothetical protein